MVSSLLEERSRIVIDVGLEPSSETRVNSGDPRLITVLEFHRLGVVELAYNLAIFSPHLLLGPKFT